MLFLIIFSFIAGFVTILSPCILPILPIVLSGAIGGGHRRPLGIVTGFVLSFTLFTLSLSAIVRATGISADILRNASVVIILLFGASLLLPNFQILMEKLFTKIASRVSGRTGQGTGYLGGVLLGISLGLVWTPCVGPIIASVITLAATNSVNGSAILITLAYSLGTAIPMFAITFGGRKLLQKVPWLLRNTGNIQKIFGVLMIFVAIAIFFNLDRKFQTTILDRFPQYGAGLIKLEDNNIVKKELEKASSQQPISDNINSMMYPSAPELIYGGEWFNSDPLTIAQLKGKVILIDFWTYTCINCIRTLPYLKSWYSKYEDQGFVIIGVHTPEFEFEKSANNVKKAITDFGLKYPIIQDNDYATWQAYSNRYWPAHYLIDKDGKIRYTHFGEGEYDKTEATIQDLLKETGAKVNDKINNPLTTNEALTHETYLGYARIAGLASPEKIQNDARAKYTLPRELPSNSFALDGDWTVKEEMALPSKGSALEFNFNAKNVYLVLNALSGSSEIKIILDGKVVGFANQGNDVAQGTVVVTQNKLYHLLKLSTPGEHILRLEFLEGNVSAFAFTFG